MSLLPNEFATDGPSVVHVPVPQILKETDEADTVLPFVTSATTDRRARASASDFERDRRGRHSLSLL